jgi:hypothetical protein
VRQQDQGTPVEQTREVSILHLSELLGGKKDHRLSGT